MNPHFLFGGAEKKTAVHGQKKRRFVSKSRLWRVWTSTRDPNKRHWEVRARCSVGRGPSLAKTCRHTARDALFRVSCCKTDLVFSSFRCLSIYLPVARSEAERAGPEAYQIRQPPLKAAPHPPQMRGKHYLCSKNPQRTRYKLPKSPPHRLARPPRLSKSAQGAGFGHESVFFSTAAAATFLSARRKKSGGLNSRPAPVARNPPSRPRGPTPPRPRPQAAPLPPLQKRRKGLVLMPPSGPRPAPGGASPPIPQ